MNVCREIQELGTLQGPLHLAIGVFDGVHRGHAAVITEARRHAQARGQQAGIVVVTFDPHPSQVIPGLEAPRLLTGSRHKSRILERCLDVSQVLEIGFDADFASLSGTEFISALVDAAPVGGIARITVGGDWRFGCRRAGDLELLTELGGRFGFEVNGVSTVEISGMRVSSTRIREAVEQGRLEDAAVMLGRPYSVMGAVVHGRRLGSTLGFPTANLVVENEQLPPPGVYVVRVLAGELGPDLRGVANLGYRPTVESGESELKLEVHLFEFEGDLYGQSLEVEFLQFLRGEMKFAGLEELQRQIAADVEAARRFNA